MGILNFICDVQLVNLLFKHKMEMFFSFSMYAHMVCIWSVFGDAFRMTVIHWIVSGKYTKKNPQVFLVVHVDESFLNHQLFW